MRPVFLYKIISIHEGYSPEKSRVNIEIIFTEENRQEPIHNSILFVDWGGGGEYCAAIIIHNQVQKFIKYIPIDDN